MRGVPSVVICNATCIITTCQTTVSLSSSCFVLKPTPAEYANYLESPGGYVDSRGGRMPTIQVNFRATSRSGPVPASVAVSRQLDCKSLSELRIPHYRLYAPLVGALLWGCSIPGLDGRICSASDSGCGTRKPANAPDTTICSDRRSCADRFAVPQRNVTTRRRSVFHTPARSEAVPENRTC